MIVAGLEAPKDKYRQAAPSRATAADGRLRKSDGLEAVNRASGLRRLSPEAPPVGAWTCAVREAALAGNAAEYRRLLAQALEDSPQTA